ncbi:MAG: hypothetical protein ACI4M5_04815 [Christensenellales bacterium]
MYKELEQNYVIIHHYSPYTSMVICSCSLYDDALLVYNALNKDKCCYSSFEIMKLSEYLQATADIKNKTMEVKQ